MSRSIIQVEGTKCVVTADDGILFKITGAETPLMSLIDVVFQFWERYRPTGL